MSSHFHSRSRRRRQSLSHPFGTEITLSDGRLVRATLHVKDVKISAQKPGGVDISYNVVAEVMAIPSVPILDVHETIQ
jgi:hypothetical protein